MGHDGGMLDQAFYAAQAFGQGKQLRALQETAALLQPALQNSGHHAAKTIHLTHGQLMLRVAWQARIVNRFHILMSFQKCGDGQGIFAVTLHAQGQGFQAPHGQKGIEGPGDGAHRVMQIG